MPSLDFSESFFIADIPSGVAALESPSIFAVMFEHISLSSFESFFTPLKTNLIIGENMCESFVVIPLFSAMFIKPDHIIINAPIFRIKLTQSGAEFITAFPTSAPEPEKMPKTNAATSIPDQT